MAACYSTSCLDPYAPPTGSMAFSPAQLCSPASFAQPLGCPLQPQYMYPPPPLSPFCGVAVGGLAPTGSANAAGGTGVTASLFFPWLQVDPLLMLYCNPPLPPALPGMRCSITEIVDDGSVEPPELAQQTEPEPEQTAVLPPLSSGVVSSRPAFDQSSKKTTLMICNIPNGFLKRRLMAILDQHCAEENKLRCLPGGEVVKSEYDFLYVPIDFRTKWNKGYAFVNMTTPTAAWRLHAFLHGHRWPYSGKVCKVVPARIQGVDALAAHFSHSMFPCGGNLEFLPVRFGPARDGLRPTAERVIGYSLVRRRSR